MRSTTFTDMVAAELQRARTLHPEPLHSLHEAAGVIREEHDEFWDEVRAKEHNNLNLLKELTHLAATCQRTAEDLLGVEGGAR